MKAVSSSSFFFKLLVESEALPANKALLDLTATELGQDLNKEFIMIEKLSYCIEKFNNTLYITIQVTLDRPTQCLGVLQDEYKFLVFPG